MLLVAWIAVPVFFWVGYYLFTKGHLTRHLGFFHFTLFFFSIYIGSLKVYLDEGSSNHTYLASVMAYPILSMLGMLAATFVAKRVYFRDVRMIFKARDVKLVVTTVAAFLAVYAVYLYKLGSNIPLLVVLSSGDAAKGYAARYIATKNYQEIVGGIGALEWFPRILIDYFLVFVLAFAYFHLRRRARDYAFFAALLAGAFLLTVVGTEKYPPVRLFVMFALCVYNSKVKKVTLNAILPAVTVVVVGSLIGGVAYGIVSGQADKLFEGRIGARAEIATEFAVDLMTTRGIETQSMALYMTYKLVPGQHEFYAGRTLVNLRGILPYKRVLFPYLVCESFRPETPGVRCSAPTAFFGEMYANFGLAISWLSMFCFGFILQVMNSRLSDTIKAARTPFSIAFFYLLMTYLGEFSISFITPYFDERIWFFAAFWLLHRVSLGRSLERAAQQDVVAA